MLKYYPFTKFHYANINKSRIPYLISALRYWLLSKIFLTYALFDKHHAIHRQISISLGRNNPSQRWRPPDRIMVRRAKIFCRHFIGGTPRKRTAIFEQAKEWLDSYFMGKIPSFTPPIHLEDTPFRLAVWDLLSKIPYGEVVTYKELAGEIARQKGIPSMSTQAIGGAVGHNPISIIIPCTVS